MGKDSVAAAARQVSGLSNAVQQKKYVQVRLKELGLGSYEMLRSEARHLHKVLHDNEKIGAVLSGKSPQGHIMLIATDGRIMVLDCKPLFNNCQDVTYFVVSGVTIGHVGPFHSVALETRVGRFSIKTTNYKTSVSFKAYIDRRCIEHARGGGTYDPIA